MRAEPTRTGASATRAAQPPPAWGSVKLASSLKPMRARLPREGKLPLVVERSETLLTLKLRNGAEICVVGMDRPERIEG